MQKRPLKENSMIKEEILTFRRPFSLWICCYSNVNYSISSWIVSKAEFQRWSLEFIKDISTVLKICHWNNFVFSVANNYALLDCCVEKFKPFIFDALAFQRNMNSIYCMKFLKPFPVEDRLYINIRYCITKLEKSSFIHILFIFLFILTPNEVNGNVATDFVRSGIWLLKFVSSYLQESQSIIIPFSQTPSLLIEPSLTNSRSSRKKTVYLQTRFLFPLRSRPQGTWSVTHITLRSLP